MEEKSKKFVRTGRIIAAVVIFSALMTTVGVIVDANSSITNTQVTVTYQTTTPGSATPYRDATLDFEDDVDEVTFTTRSIGRLQWGEPDKDGNYAVYYDAGDIHTLAAYLNQASENYNTLYSTYVDSYNVIMH